MRGAHPERAVEQHVVQSGVLRRGEHIVIACSGGPDSVALAAVLHAVAPQLDLDLTIAHVNHRVRDSAWQDECVALRIAARLGLNLDVVALASEHGGEAELRDRRYKALAESARRSGATTIATAHHAEDQTESVLLALFRGTGPEGIAGMPVRRRIEPDIELLRPLLRVTAEDLRYYCHVSALPYAVDPTNENEALRRNAVRQALAALRPAFPSLDEAVARAAELVASERAGAPRAALRERVREALREQGGLRDVDFEHVEAAVRTMELGGSGRFLMKKDVTLHVTSRNLKDG